MAISPNSYSNYQNAYSIKQNNYLKNKPQKPENAPVSFKGLEKVATKTTQGKNFVLITAITAFISALFTKFIKGNSKNALSNEDKILTEKLRAMTYEGGGPNEIVYEPLYSEAAIEVIVEENKNNPELALKLIDILKRSDHVKNKEDIKLIAKELKTNPKRIEKYEKYGMFCLVDILKAVKVNEKLFDILHNYNANNFRFSTDVSSNIVLALKKYGILDESTTNYNIENSTPEELIPYLLARLSAAVANGNKHY